MDRKIVQDIFRNKVRVGDVVDIVSMSPLDCLTGQFTVLSTKVGRGKGGGAQVFELQNATTGEKLKTVTLPDKVKEIGTGISDYLLKITHNNIVYGAETLEEAMRLEGKPSNEISDSLLTLFESLQKGQKINVEMSTQEHPSNGTWLVEDLKPCVGRKKQKKLILKDPANSNRVTELWSFRDSGKIVNITD